MEPYIGGWNVASNFGGNPFDPKTLSKTHQNHEDFSGWGVGDDGHISPYYPDKIGQRIAVMQAGKKQDPDFKSSLVINTNLTPLLDDPQKRANFLSDLKALIQSDGFDGVTLDWEWPPQGRESETTAFLKQIKGVLPPQDTLSLCVGFFPSFRQGYDFSELKDFVDYFEMMDYDMNGTQPSGESNTSLLSLLKSMRNGMKGYLDLGIDPQKLIAIFPLYGYAWSGVSPGTNGDGLNQKGEAVPNYRYSDVIKLAQEHPEYVHYSSDGDSWYYDPNTDGGLFIQFESSQAIQEKVNLLMQDNIGGVSIWTINFDTSDASGLQEISDNLLSPSLG